MLNVSTEFSRAVSENSTLLVAALIRFNVDGGTEEVPLTGDDIVSMTIEQGTSSSSSFDIGAAVIGQLSLTLNNHDGRFDERDFTDALIKVWVGKDLSTEGDENVEWVERGRYIVDRPDSYSGVISVTALDYMSKFEKVLPTSDITFPISVQSLVSGLCSHVGVELLKEEIPNGSYSIGSASLDSGDTCLSLLRYALQIIGCYARMDNMGRLSVEWYDTAVFENEDWLDGGSFDASSPYATGSSTDGGDFTDYSSGDSADGGTLAANRRYHLMHAFNSITVNTDDVVVTGISVTAQNEVLEDGDTRTPTPGETYTSGSEGYVLSVSSNPLIEFGRAAEVAVMLADRIAGMRFRPFSGKALCNPAVEAGDPVLVIDRKGNMYRSYATSVSLAVNSGMQVSCSAKSASRNSADNAGAATSAIVAARRAVKQEMTSRDVAIKNIGDQLANGGGLYSTVKQDSSGASIYYLHNKPTLGESKIVYKITADAIGISTDGGETYATALSATGDAILNRLSVTGIDASIVNISNMMKIGDSENSVNIDPASIDFTMQGQSGSLTITPSSKGFTTMVLQNASDQSKAYASAAIGSTTKVNTDFCPPNPHQRTGYSIVDGKMTFYYKLTCRAYWSSAFHDLTFEGRLPVTDETVKAGETYGYGSDIAAVRLLDNSEVTINLVASTLPSVDFLCAQGAYVTLHPTSGSVAELHYLSLTTWSDSVTSSIHSDVTGETYLSDKNFALYANGGDLFTGGMRVPVIYNNIHREYVFNVRNGLIVDAYVTDAL